MYTGLGTAEDTNARYTLLLSAMTKKGLQGSVNLTPAIIEATRAYATIGEITQVLRKIFGEFHKPATL
jgi:methylmalonyl-CoA mutase N-terminal domain/subunit